MSVTDVVDRHAAVLAAIEETRATIADLVQAQREEEARLTFLAAYATSLAPTGSEA